MELPNSLGYAGVMLDFVTSLKSGNPKHMVLSVPNDGSIEGFAEHDVVEVSCIVDSEGAKPVPIGTVPEQMEVLMRSVKLFERLTVEAVRHKSRDLGVQALAVHPLVQSYSLAKSWLTIIWRLTAMFWGNGPDRSPAPECCAHSDPVIFLHIRLPFRPLFDKILPVPTQIGDKFRNV